MAGPPLHPAELRAAQNVTPDEGQLPSPPPWALVPRLRNHGLTQSHEGARLFLVHFLVLALHV